MISKAPPTTTTTCKAPRTTTASTPVTGSDTVHGQAGNDHLLGGAGWDTLYGGAGHDRLDGGPDSDNLYGSDGHDLLQGGAGADLLDGGDRRRPLRWWPRGRPYLAAPARIFVLSDGASGADTIELVPGLPGANVLRFASHTAAELSFNWVPGELRVSTLDGQALATVRGLTTEHVPFQRVEFADGSAWEGDALLQGLLSNPQGGVSLGGAGDDVLAGGEGRDLMLGRGGHDLLQGGAGDDELQGGEGHDVLHGGAGNDLLAGGAGDDWLAGGAGLDQLVGGSGLDTFVLGESAGSSVIRDDAAEANRIQLAPGVALGSLSTELRGGSSILSAPAGSELQIADYGQQAQGYGAWAVRDDAGASTTLAALVAAIVPDDSLYGRYRAAALAEIDAKRPRWQQQWDWVLDYGALEIEPRALEVTGEGRPGKRARFPGTERARRPPHSAAIGSSVSRMPFPAPCRRCRPSSQTEYGIVGYTTERHALDGGSAFQVPAGASVSYEMAESSTGITTYAVVSTPRYGAIERSEQRVVERIEYDHVEGVEAIPMNTSHRTSRGQRMAGPRLRPATTTSKSATPSTGPASGASKAATATTACWPAPTCGPPTIWIRPTMARAPGPNCELACTSMAGPATTPSARPTPTTSSSVGRATTCSAAVVATTAMWWRPATIGSATSAATTWPASTR